MSDSSSSSDSSFDSDSSSSSFSEEGYQPSRRDYQKASSILRKEQKKKREKEKKKRDEERREQNEKRRKARRWIAKTVKQIIHSPDLSGTLTWFEITSCMFSYIWVNKVVHKNKSDDNIRRYCDPLISELKRQGIRASFKWTKRKVDFGKKQELMITWNK